MAKVGHDKRLLQLSIGAIGVVYGDLGTSPLYTLRECFNASEALIPTVSNVLGILSLIFWSIVLVISVKYVSLIMRADNNGEGGILSLMALALRKASPAMRLHIGMAGIFGAALFFGDGIITPAISVLSALEGLKVATPIFTPYIVPLSIVILMGLFLFQARGAGGLGRLFGPIMCIWFICIALLGLAQIIRFPIVLWAVNPYYAGYFLWTFQSESLSILAAVFLCLTGAEALYADMGHFGRNPIRRAWYYLVFPSLLLNYFGQGALVLGNPDAIENPFYHLAPTWGLYPLVLLATLATVIASQAVISGTFSLGRQAMQLGYLPRLKISHTSAKEIGQVFLPQVNRWMLLLVIGLVLQFQTSDGLASAYGVAVSGIMVITTLLTFFVARQLWGWGWFKVSFIFGGLLLLDGIFCFGNLLKIAEGGWIPLLVAIGVYTVMLTWKTGREILLHQIRRSSIAASNFIKDVRKNKPYRVPGTAIFMSSSRDVVPYSLLLNLKHNKIIHERVILLSIVTKDMPYIPKAQRLEIEDLGENFYRVTANYGFMQNPNVTRVIEQAAHEGLVINIAESTFFLSRGIPVKDTRQRLFHWREKLFAYLSRNSASATEFFTIPHQRVVELRIQFKV